MGLANLITLGRLLSVPVAIWLVLSGEVAAAFWLFVAAGLSDAVDGFVAKRFDQRSRLGALLDPIADKALLVSMYVTLGIAGHLPTWLVILVVFRDALIIGGFLLVAALGQPMRWEPLLVSKVNTAMQIALIGVVLAELGLGLALHALVAVMVYAAGATTVISGAGYLVRWTRTLAGTEMGT
ncbi:MAG TPA: CDP-alcohol phosphatidyltransferase family protein [Stellaceae bacterium]|nr:CDP-alcohol phosphatidyltransferase family protein [Stellaceae bacterium]